MVKKNRKEIILVVDDSPDTLEVLHRNIEHMGFEVYSCEGANEAIEILKNNHIDLVITDYHMPFVGGLDLIRHVRENYRNTEVMMITGYASVEGAVEAIKAGAEEYLSKPFTDEELEEAIERALEKLCIRAVRKSAPTKDISRKYGMIGESDSMKRVFSSIKKAASSSLPVLISGEAGTGKELAARVIHYESDTAGHPFITINCREIPESILESEIFGFMQSCDNSNPEGSGQACSENKVMPGFLELAREGTLFFNEISETPLPVQIKLLNVFTSGEFTPVGDNTTRLSKCRIIASSSRDLINLASRGLFREDLFFRLNRLNINIPPLRERDNDIMLICKEYLGKACLENGNSPIPEFSERAALALLRYEWSGNIREVEIMIQNLARNIDGSTVEVSDLPHHMRYNLTDENSFNRSLQEVEKDYIKAVLSRFGGNKTRAAELLGIDRKTLRDKLSK